MKGGGVEKLEYVVRYESSCKNLKKYLQQSKPVSE
jgi:hypothetical protein